MSVADSDLAGSIYSIIQPHIYQPVSGTLKLVVVLLELPCAFAVQRNTLVYQHVHDHAADLFSSYREPCVDHLERRAFLICASRPK
jgi:hypothetical protein